MSDKDIYEGIQGVLLWLKNIGVGFAGFLATVFFKGAMGKTIDKKKEIMAFGLSLCIFTIIGSIFNLLGILDINKQTIIYWCIGAFSMKIMEKWEKIFIKKLEKLGD